MRGARILVAVHEPELRASLRVGLQLVGCLVAEAADGKSALGILREEPAQLLLLDLEIPVVGSIAVLAEVRAGPAAQRARVVTLTRHDEIPVAVESIRLGASDFLEKPVVIDDVKSSIASVLDDSPPRDYLTGEKLGSIRAALLSGTFNNVEAEMELPARNTEAGFLNLAGIVHESHGRLQSARDFYLRSIGADERYLPAWDNLNRLTELCRYDDRMTPPFLAGPPRFRDRTAYLTLS